MVSVLETLEQRGFVASCTSDCLATVLRAGPVTLYVGFDPTADSLHMGHLVPIMALSHFQQAGHRVLLVVGGATGMIGDPSGRSDERNLLGPEQIAANVEAIKPQFSRFLRFDGPNPAILVNNYDWIAKMSFIDWLREIGKHFTVNYMLSKESVCSRLESEQGITFTEFSYMTMQAYDFLHLFDAFGCVLQCGGTDQWGNITAGIELIRKLRQTETYGLTCPLVTTAGGEKFGKSQGNAVWLDRRRTTPWDLYQYLIRQDDRDVIRFLKLYTYLPLDQISALERAVVERPENREAQGTLAREVTRMLHGEATAAEVAKAAHSVFYSDISGLTDETLAAAFAEVPQSEVALPELQLGMPLTDLLPRIGMVGSKGEAKRLLTAGGVYVNNRRVGETTVVTDRDLASESLLVIRTGKKTYHLIKVKRN